MAGGFGGRGWEQGGVGGRASPGCHPHHLLSVHDRQGPSQQKSEPRPAEWRQEGAEGQKAQREEGKHRGSEGALDTKGPGLSS